MLPKIYPERNHVKALHSSIQHLHFLPTMFNLPWTRRYLEQFTSHNLDDIMKQITFIYNKNDMMNQTTNMNIHDGSLHKILVVM